MNRPGGHRDFVTLNYCLTLLDASLRALPILARHRDPCIHFPGQPLIRALRGCESSVQKTLGLLAGLDQISLPKPKFREAGMKGETLVPVIRQWLIMHFVSYLEQVLKRAIIIC